MNTDAFAGLEQGKVRGAGEYLSAGEFVVEISDITYKPTFKQGDSLIVEFVIVETNNTADAVGSKRSWVEPKKSMYFNDEVIAFLLATMGISAKDTEKVTKVTANSRTLMNRALTENIFKGSRLRVSAFKTITKTERERATAEKREPAPNFMKLVFKPYEAPAATA